MALTSPAVGVGPPCASPASARAASCRPLPHGLPRPRRYAPSPATSRRASCCWDRDKEAMACPASFVPLACPSESVAGTASRAPPCSRQPAPWISPGWANPRSDLAVPSTFAPVIAGSAETPAGPAASPLHLAGVAAPLCLASTASSDSSERVDLPRSSLYIGKREGMLLPRASTPSPSTPPTAPACTLTWARPG